MHIFIKIKCNDAICIIDAVFLPVVLPVGVSSMLPFKLSSEFTCLFCLDWLKYTQKTKID